MKMECTSNNMLRLIYIKKDKDISIRLELGEMPLLLYI